MPEGRDLSVIFQEGKDLPDGTKYNGFGNPCRVYVYDDKKVCKFAVGCMAKKDSYSETYAGIPSSGQGRVVELMVVKDGITDSDSKKLTRKLGVMEDMDNQYIQNYYGGCYFMKLPGNTTRSIVHVMERTEHGTLYSFTKYTGTMSEPLARTFMHQLASAIGALHRAGITHRCISPTNIFLGENYTIKLSGFEHAHRDGDGLPMREVVGRESYQSLEMRMIADGEPQKGYTNKCDVWSLGLILYFMIWKRHLLVDRPWFDQVVQNNFERLWQATEYYFKRSKTHAKLHASCLKFIEVCLEPESKRPSIDDVFKQTWMKGEKVDPKNIHAEFLDARNYLGEEAAKIKPDHQQTLAYLEKPDPQEIKRVETRCFERDAARCTLPFLRWPKGDRRLQDVRALKFKNDDDLTDFKMEMCQQRIRNILSVIGSWMGLDEWERTLVAEFKGEDEKYQFTMIFNFVEEMETKDRYLVIDDYGDDYVESNLLRSIYDIILTRTKDWFLREAPNDQD